jgi:hypothetical protein
MKKRAFLIVAFICTFVLLTTFTVRVQNAVTGEPKRLRGQTVYVSIYSHIIVGERKRGVKFNLSVNLSIRNTDFKSPITVIAADYFDSQGKLIKNSITKPVSIGPMASLYFSIKQPDTNGGWGANYIIKWKSEKKVNEPIIESATYGWRGTQAISFLFQGKVLEEISDK